MNGSTHPASADEPITPDLLADLQAGLLDDATAARLRHRVRTDPEAAATLAALDRVRRDLAALGTDTESAPPLSPQSAARVAATLRHLERRPSRRLRTAALMAGACATLVAVGVGTATLMRAPGPAPSAPASIKELTQSPPPRDIGLSESQILGLLSARPDFGALTDPQRRADCLAGLGYPPGIKILGARPLDVGGQPGILILLPDDTPGTVIALVITPDCTAAHSGVLAVTSISLPVKRP